MLLKDFRPQSKLVTKTTQALKPKFPVIDAHNHLGEVFGGGWDKKPLSQLLDLLDEAGVTHYVDLDGGWGEDILDAHLKHFKAGAPERFQIFGGVEWGKWPELGNQFPAWAAKRLIAQKARGAQGLKIWKPFGLHVKDQHGKLADVDDERLSPIWETAGELGLPVLIHVADPVAFFDPIDETNERWEELGNHPDWAFTSPPFPPFMHILNCFKNLVARHPATTFIGAHVGCYAENLGWVGQMLEACPNYYIDISARFGELGRQPYTARKFFIEYQDRILYGSDFSPKLEAYRLSYRLLETDDEYFNYSVGEIPRQGRFYAYGLRLPDDVLRKIYRENAAKILNIR
ncbi:MAG: amidohydrolase family protein [Anaerolineales bacterium]|nr:amidohydrolase family protein [Anaerolineales bacterium]